MKNTYFSVLSVFLISLLFMGGVHSYFYIGIFVWVILIYLFYLFYYYKFGFYKNIKTNIEFPLLLFIVYNLFQFIPFIHSKTPFSKPLNEFNKLWSDLGFIEKIDYSKSHYLFDFYNGLFLLLLIVSFYFWIKILLFCRKDIFKLKIYLFLLFNIVIILYLAEIPFYSSVFGFDIKSFGFFVNKNHLASFISIPVPIIFFYFFVNSKNENKEIFIFKILYFIYLFYLIYSLQSRMVFLSLILGLAVYFIVERKSIIFKYKMMILFLFIILLGVFTFLMFSKNIIDSNINYLEQITSEGSINGRFEMIIIALKMFPDNLLFGIGVNQFALIYPYYSGLNNSFIHHLHNEYIQFLVEYGIIGIFIFIFFYYEFTKTIIHSFKFLKKNHLHLFISVFISIIILHIQCLSDFLLHLGIFVFIFGFLIAYIYIINYNFEKYSNTNDERKNL